MNVGIRMGGQFFVRVVCHVVDFRRFVSQELFRGRRLSPFSHTPCDIKQATTTSNQPTNQHPRTKNQHEKQTKKRTNSRRPRINQGRTSTDLPVGYLFICQSFGISLLLQDYSGRSKILLPELRQDLRFDESLESAF